MSEILNVLSWNLEEAKSGGLNNPEIRSKVLDLAPDVAVFPEGLAEGGLKSDTARVFEQAGYILKVSDYNDADDRKDRHALGFIAKPELIKDIKPSYYYGRVALATLVTGTTFVGLHLDDRAESSRKVMTKNLLGELAWAKATNAIIAGDFNSMYSGSFWARFLQDFKPVIDQLPSQEPGQPQSKIERLGSLAQRLAEMADGGTMKLFTEGGFSDVDPKHQPTKSVGPLGVQIDHILQRGLGVRILKTTEVLSSDGLADHKPILAQLRA